MVTPLPMTVGAPPPTTTCSCTFVSSPISTMPPLVRMGAWNQTFVGRPAGRHRRHGRWRPPSARVPGRAGRSSGPRRGSSGGVACGRGAGGRGGGDDSRCHLGPQHLAVAGPRECREQPQIRHVSTSRAARASTAVSSSARGTTWLTRPQSNALAAMTSWQRNAHLPGAAVADHERQPPGDADAGRTANERSDLPDDHVVGRHGEVTGQVQLVAPAENHPVEARERRLAASDDGGLHRDELADPRHVVARALTERPVLVQSVPTPSLESWILPARLDCGARSIKISRFWVPNVEFPAQQARRATGMVDFLPPVRSTMITGVRSVGDQDTGPTVMAVIFSEAEVDLRLEGIDELSRSPLAPACPRRYRAASSMSTTRTGQVAFGRSSGRRSRPVCSTRICPPSAGCRWGSGSRARPRGMCDRSPTRSGSEGQLRIRRSACQRPRVIGGCLRRRTVAPCGLCW